MLLQQAHVTKVPFRGVARAAGLISLTGLTALLSVAPSARAQTPLSVDDSLARAILKELIEINTAPSGGPVTRASQAVARRLIAAGYPRRDVELAGPNERFRNVVARLRGRDPGAKPIILMAHLDVVEARKSDWSFDPFVLREQEGYFYGRGATDNKAGASILVANMIRWKRERYVPGRDVLLVLTTDEETTAENGIQWLVKHRPELRKAEYALNTDAGGVLLRDGKPAIFAVQSAEKVYQSYTLEVKNRGGHSSIPRRDNAIYALAGGLVRLATFRFPVQYDDITRASFARAATLESGQLADDMRAAGRGETTGAAIDRLSEIPHLNGNLRTTCVATMLTGGHAENALPQSATATVNCRVFPGSDLAQVRAILQRVVGDTAISITPLGDGTPSPPSPVRADVFGTMESLAGTMWPGVTMIPILENGATDGLFLRNVGVPVYGAAAILYDPSDERAHGRDERVGVKAFYDAREFWYRMVKQLTGGAAIS